MTVEEINNYLDEKYGRTVDNKPLYRVVWSTNLTETRVRTYYKFDENKNFIGIAHDSRDALKYPFDQERWILEKYQDIDDPELPEKRNYEVLWVFKDKDGNFLPLNRDMVDIFLHFHINRDKYKRTPTQIQEDYDKEQDKEREWLIQKIGENQQLWHAMDLIE